MGYKKKKLSKYYLKKRIERIKRINKNSGNDILKSINKGYTTYDIVDDYGISYRTLIYYLEYYGLKSKVDYNSKEKLRKTAIENGKKAADVLSGKEKKKITPDIIEWYMDVVNRGWYKMQVMEGLQEKFGYGRKKYQQLVDEYGAPTHNCQSGKENPMYGVSPSKKSGIGIKSWININGSKYFCRSSLELRVFIYLYENNIKFEPSKHRIKYKYKNKDKTYMPDITLMESNTVCEIKPEYATKHSQNIEKFKNAKLYCSEYNLNFKVITETTYSIEYIDFDKINSYIESGMIEIDDIEYERLKNNIK